MKIQQYLKKIIDNYFYFSNDEHLSIKDQKAISLNNMLSLIICFYLIILGTSLLKTNFYYVGLFDYALVILFALNYIIFLTTKNVALQSHITAILFGIIIIFLVITGGKDGTGPIWGLYYPILTTQVLGYKRGIIYSIVLVLIMYILLFPIQNLPIMYNYSKSFINPPAVIVRIFIVYSGIFFIAATSAKNKHDLHQELEETIRAKKNLFINLAHETKTPLTLIRNSLNEYIKKHDFSNELALIKQNINKLQRDMINYLDIQKLENKQLFYNHKRITELCEIITRKSELIKAYLLRNNITLQIDMQVDHAYVAIDPEAFDRIINNLLDNAVKYNKKDGSIKISMTESNNTYIMGIKDTGQGMPENELEHLFDPYYQMSHKKRNTQGLGMGLSIIKEIVDSIDGKINVETTLNEGSHFTIIFKKHNPNKIIDNEEPIETSPVFELLPLENLPIKDSEYDKDMATILIVEDNKPLLSYLVNNLNDSYNVYHALNGKEALEKITTIHKPDIILSDVMMDSMDGYDFKENLNSDKRFNMIPFIFLTAKTSDKDRLQGLSIGAIDFISKPFSLDELLYKIHTITKINKALTNERMQKLSQQIVTYMKKSDIQPTPQENTVKTNEDDLSFTETALALYNISAQELKVASMLTEGLLYKEIGYELDISINTVRTHVKRVYKKLNINSRKELVAIFKETSHFTPGNDIHQ